MVNNPLNKALFFWGGGIRRVPSPDSHEHRMDGWIERTCFLGIHFVSKWYLPVGGSLRVPSFVFNISRC